jgi:hypothetical protein
MLKLSPDEILMIQKWNLFLTKLLECEKTWKELVELRESVRINHDLLPPAAGKFFGLATSRSIFTVAIGRLLDYARKYSSLQEMIVQLPETKVEEKKEVSNARRK